MPAMKVVRKAIASTGYNGEAEETAYFRRCSHFSPDLLVQEATRLQTLVKSVSERRGRIRKAWLDILAIHSGIMLTQDK